ncbi:2950_t:CDS:1 [Ambispora gerdemannii]|uniref:2950_t:CDS:1 n=1 Tax=Ambispora gerdemannii TaxID=144530 RepID=A0A9N9FWK8_9GLOM|nr:2950_t:CDS:1 [Ambispora gerdemannii]
MSQTSRNPSWDILSQQFDFIGDNNLMSNNHITGQKKFGERKKTNQNINVIEKHTFDLSDFHLFDDENNSLGCIKLKKNEKYMEYTECENDIDLFGEKKTKNETNNSDFSSPPSETNQNNNTVYDSQIRRTDYDSQIRRTDYDSQIRRTNYDSQIRRTYSHNEIHTNTDIDTDFPLYPTRSPDFSLENMSNPNPYSYPELNDITNSLSLFLTSER